MAVGAKDTQRKIRNTHEVESVESQTDYETT